MRRARTRRRMQRDGEKDREEQGVARYLQAEIDERLGGNGDESDGRAGPHPVVLHPVIVPAEAAVDAADGEDDGDERGEADEEAAFGEQLQVVVVRFLVVQRSARLVGD